MKLAVVIDGKLVDSKSASIPIFDRGFLFGDGVSETILARKKLTFASGEHIERLVRSCEAIRITPPDSDDVVRSIDAALAAGSFDFAAVRVMVTRGDAGLSIDALDSAEKLRVIVIAREIAAPEKYVTPISVARARTAFSAVRGAKGIAYSASIAARIVARERAFDDAIYVDAREHVIEGATSNVFAVVNDSLVAPLTDALPGITRRHVLTLANAEKISVETRALRYDELARATEIFLTSSLRGIAPVARVEDVTFIAPGPITKRMQDAYFASVTKALAIA